MRALIVSLLLAACGGSAPKAVPVAPPKPVVAPPAPASELSTAEKPIAWLLGDWQGQGGSEHWTAAGGAIYGVVLRDKGTFEVMIVDDADGGPADGLLRLFALLGGTESHVFEQSDFAAQRATFSAQKPQRSITYQRTVDGLGLVLAGERGTVIDFAFTPLRHVAAPELEAADLAFAAATKATGVDGWLAAFAPTGHMMRKGTPIERDKIAETMRPLLSSGTLAWAPIASHANGDLGFTVGKATFTGATPGASWKSTYVTIWQRQSDGTWKVLFDTGRGVDEP